MKKLRWVHIAIFLFPIFAMAESLKFDKKSIELANVLLHPEVTACIDSHLAGYNVYRNSFSIEEIENYTATEPMFPESKTSERTQRVDHFILQTKFLQKAADNALKTMRLKIDIAVASGTGILSYSCSAQPN